MRSGLETLSNRGCEAALYWAVSDGCDGLAQAPVTTGEVRFKAGQFESEDWRR
jgi:hypothetical protein